MEKEIELTTTLEEYLATIFKLEKKSGVARANEIADSHGVSRSTVTTALKSLGEKNLIFYKPYNPIKLTPQGFKIGQKIAHRNLILNDFFERILQLPGEKARATACKVEHVITDDVIIELGRFIFFLTESGYDIENWKGKYAMPKNHWSR